jgi:hypothetical protein
VVGSIVASLSINSARDLAWRNALLLWALRDEPAGRGLFLDGLAAQVALASRLLLVAVRAALSAPGGNMQVPFDLGLKKNRILIRSVHHFVSTAR